MATVVTVDLFAPTFAPADLLAAVWGNGPHSLGWDNGSGYRHAIADTPSDLLALAAKHVATANVWYSAHPLKARPAPGKRGTAADVAEVKALEVKA